MRRGFAAVLAVLAAAGTAIAPARAADHATVTRARWLMGTQFTASAPAATDADSVGRALDAALDTVAALERRLSNWSPASELSRLNATDGAAEWSAPLAAVLDSALAFAALTGGAFDPTVEPLTRAWDLRGTGRVPSARELAAARARVGWRRVTRGPGTARVALGGAQLDLGGIAKGFALDRAAALLAARGVRAATLDAGGQRLVLGAESCSVWVAHPLERDAPAVCVRVAGASLSTSAQSEHGFRAHGRRMGHVLDPRTGVPVATRASVSVRACSATRADALSTALLVLGRDAARAFARAHPEYGVLWLEPIARRHKGLQVQAWNLEIAGTAAGLAWAP